MAADEQDRELTAEERAERENDLSLAFLDESIAAWTSWDEDHLETRA